MRKIALTGNIASGKSEVQSVLVSMGYKVLDTDLLGHEILKKSEEVKEAFKNYDILDNNEISRPKLGKVVFSNKDLLSKLNAIVHPKIREMIAEFFELNKAEEKVFVAIPLLFEANMEDLFDEIVFIYADDNMCLERLKKRNNFSEEEAKLRINAQTLQKEKLSKSDIIIYNEGTIEALRDEVLKKLC